MNCPGHCLMFKHQKVSYRELPIRLADFGVLHRNELTGALSGLTRVRRFQQDDAHIFCSVDSIGAEVQKCLEFMRDVYAIFGFKFSLALSTRPEQYIGSINVWDKAEKALEISLNNFGCEWTFNKGDGAFYGPKIDILLKDALGRSIQCATIQLDFNLPSKDCFDLTFSNNKGEYERPVIVHRAILGSIERFVSILAEHCGGKWPFWISPRQIMVVPVSEKHLDFAEKVRQDLHQIGFEADCDRTNNKMQKKVRTAQVSQYNVILVVGEKEIETNVFTVRYRNRKDFDQMTFDELVSMLSCWVKEKK